MKRLRELDMHLLVVFDSLCKTGSVTQTADQLSLTQGAVSQSLKKLRTLFGDELFVRSKAGLVRTQRGQELAQPIRELLFKGEEILLSQTAFDPEHAERNITLSMMDIGDVAIVPTLLKRLRRDAPGCTVQTRPVDVRATGDAMEAGTIDLVIGGREISGGEIMRQKLYTQRLVLLAHEKSNLPDTIDMRELCSLDHVGIQTGSGNKSIYEKAMQVRGAQRRIVATTSHSLAIPYWLESDPHLVACVPIYLADLCVERGGAADFIEKPFDDALMMSAIRKAVSEQSDTADASMHKRELAERIASLSVREREVMEALVEGKANKAIAFDLGISARTVEVYRANAMMKMRAKTLSDLVRMATIAQLGG